jgi:hypothetical protein
MQHHAAAGMKYTVKVSRRGPQSFRVFLGNSHVDVVARKLNDGGLLVQVRHTIARCALPQSAEEPLLRNLSSCSCQAHFERGGGGQARMPTV